jgi:hypothetical protein
LQTTRVVAAELCRGQRPSVGVRFACCA